MSEMTAGMSTAVPRGRSPIVRITAEAVPRQAMLDLLEGLQAYPLWIRLAAYDLRQRFRRSFLGPFWFTLSMGIMVGALGVVNSTVFGQDASKSLPFIATGLIFWGLLSSCINEGATVFTAAESFIRNVPMPLSVHLYRMVARNVMICGFNMVIYLAVVIWFRLTPGWGVLLAIPGFVLLVFSATWLALASAVLSTRFRDIPQLITSLLQVVFFITPIFWSPTTLPHRMAFVDLNPLYHLVEVVRAPLLGTPVPEMSWLFCVGLAVVGFLGTAWLYRRAHARIAYWV
jgi:lipopolysaccharide transport system permease protein